MKRSLPRTIALFACVALLLSGLAAWRYQATRPEVRLRKGQEALRRGDADAAYRMVATLRQAGDADQARLLHGELLYRGGRFADAVEEFNGITDTRVVRREAVAFSGQCLLQMGELREAERAFTFVLSEDADNVEANHGLADLYYYQGALQRAVDCLDRLMQLDAKDGRVFWLKGRIYKDLDRKPEAVGLLKDALAKNLPEQLRAAAREDLAEILVEQGDYAAARDVIGSGTAPDEMPIPLLALQADALRGLGRAAEAQALLDEALRRHPAAAPLLHRRAQLYLDAGTAGPAAALLEKAVQMEENLRIHHLLAQAYERLNRPEDAERERRRVRTIQDGEQQLTKLNREANDRPWDAAVRRRLAEVCRQVGKKDLATMWERSAAACERSTRALP